MTQYNIDNKVVKKPSDDRELTAEEAMAAAQEQADDVLYDFQ